MDADELGPEQAALQRARLHIRGGKRRLRQGKTAAGIVTLYDALDHAMEWYLLAGERRHDLAGFTREQYSSRDLFGALRETAILDGSFDYDTFDRLTEKALHEELPGYPCEKLVADLDGIMTSLGVMPFREEDLPPEDPSTF